MALSDDDKKQVIEMMSDAVSIGMAKFRSKAEEEEAKRKQEEDKAPPKPEEKNDNDGGFDPIGWFLGG